MRYTQIDGNVAALFRHQEQLDQDYRDDEIYERGAAEKPMDEQAAALVEEGIIEAAFREARMDIVTTDFDSSLLALETAIMKHAKTYDREKPK